MERQNKCKQLGFSTISWAVAAVMLSGVPCVWAEDIDYPVTGSLTVNGTVNLLPGAAIEWWVYTNDTSILNIKGGTVGYWIDVAADAEVTVYGTGFNLGEGTHFIDFGTVTGIYENGDSINLTFDCQPGATVTLTAPSIDPVQMLIDLGLYIMDQVDQYQEPIPPDNQLIGIAPELEVSLLAKVDAALAALDRGNPNDAKVAMNDMKALVNQVLAQTLKKISFEASEGIQGQADAIITALGG